MLVKQVKARHSGAACTEVAAAVVVIMVKTDLYGSCVCFVFSGVNRTQENYWGSVAASIKLTECNAVYLQPCVFELYIMLYFAPFATCVELLADHWKNWYADDESWGVIRSLVYFSSVPIFAIRVVWVVGSLATLSCTCCAWWGDVWARWQAI